MIQIKGKVADSGDGYGYHSGTGQAQRQPPLEQPEIRNFLERGVCPAACPRSGLTTPWKQICMSPTRLLLPTP